MIFNKRNRNNSWRSYLKWCVLEAIVITTVGVTLNQINGNMITSGLYICPSTYICVCIAVCCYEMHLYNWAATVCFWCRYSSVLSGFERFLCPTNSCRSRCQSFTCYSLIGVAYVYLDLLFIEALHTTDLSHVSRGSLP